MITKSKHIRAGKLDKRVTFRYYGSSSDGMGGLDPSTPTDILTTWASIEPLSGEELLSQGALQSNITHRIQVRHRSDLVSKGYTRSGYDHLLEAKYKSRKFNIHRAINEGEDDVYVTMIATEEVGDED